MYHNKNTFPKNSIHSSLQTANLIFFSQTAKYCKKMAGCQRFLDADTPQAYYRIFFELLVIPGLFLDSLMILDKGLHCLIRSQSEALVKLGRAPVSFFGALPEQAVVIAQERSVFHL